MYQKQIQVVLLQFQQRVYPNLIKKQLRMEQTDCVNSENNTKTEISPESQETIQNLGQQQSNLQLAQIQHQQNLETYSEMEMESLEPYLNEQCDLQLQNNLKTHYMINFGAKENCDFKSNEIKKQQLFQQTKNVQQAVQQSEEIQQKPEKNDQKSEKIEKKPSTNQEQNNNQQNQQSKKAREDLRQMVSNSTFYPYNCLGKIFVKFPKYNKQKNKYQQQYGTAFLITPKHIMTARHTLQFNQIDTKMNRINKKHQPSQIQFFPEPLFYGLKPAYGIKAEIVLEDYGFGNAAQRKDCDWVVLELKHQKNDYRTRNFLECKFDYEFDNQKQSLIIIPGYPRKDLDFAQKAEQKKAKINRPPQNINALYQHGQKAYELTKTKKHIKYLHSTTKGTSGAPLILYDPKTQSYKVIGVHIQNQMGLLFKPLRHRDKIQNIISEHKDYKLKRIQAAEGHKQISHLVIQQMLKSMCDIYKLQCEYKNPGKCLLKIAEKAICFPLLYSIRSSSEPATQKIDDETFKKFVPKAYCFPNLSQITITHSNLTDKAFIFLFQHANRFPSLENIDFFDNKITGQEFKTLSQVQKRSLSRLRFIALNNNQVTDQGLIGLVMNGGKMPLLVKIQLNENKITDQGLIALTKNGKNLPNLESLCLNKNQITDQGFKFFCENNSGMPKLTGIYFNYNKITDAGLKSFFSSKNFANLIQIFMDQLKTITDESLKQLALNGKNFRCLKQIHLINNKITDQGLIALVSSQNLLNLKKIFLKKNLITINGLVYLVINFRNYQYVDILSKTIKPNQNDAIKKLMQEKGLKQKFEHLKTLKLLDC